MTTLPMPLWAIVAVDEGGVIGRDNGLPWHMPEDLRFFKQKTLGHSVVMGRRCFESIACRPLPGRPTVVLTTRHGARWDGVRVQHTLDDAIAQARLLGEQPPFILGGAEVYRAAMPRITRFYVTRIPGRHDGDVILPPLDPGLVREDAVPGRTPGLVFETWGRREGRGECADRR